MPTGRRYELTDFEWSIIEPLLPNKPRGVPRVDDRKVLNGIYWRLAPAHLGLRSLSATVHRPHATTASFAGVSSASGIGSSRRSPPSMTAICR